jgi:hypothetical protein
MQHFSQLLVFSGESSSTYSVESCSPPSFPAMALYGRRSFSSVDKPLGCSAKAYVLHLSDRYPACFLVAEELLRAQTSVKVENGIDLI